MFNNAAAMTADAPSVVMKNDVALSALLQLLLILFLWVLLLRVWMLLL